MPTKHTHSTPSTPQPQEPPQEPHDTPEAPQPPDAQPTTQAPPEAPPEAPQDPGDGSQPLTTGRPKGRHEQYAQLRATGETQAESYKLSGNRRLKTRNAGIAASNLEANPEVQRRIAYLKMLARNGQPLPQLDNTGQERTTVPAAQVKELDRESILNALTLALNSAVASQRGGDIASAIREIRAFLPSLLQEKDESIPDPLAIVTYLVTAPDKHPGKIAKELNGLEWIIGRVQALTRCKPDALRAACETVANSVALREAKRVRH